jgi:hypothetical protein
MTNENNKEPMLLDSNVEIMKTIVVVVVHKVVHRQPWQPWPPFLDEEVEMV